MYTLPHSPCAEATKVQEMVSLLRNQELKRDHQLLTPGIAGLEVVDCSWFCGLPPGPPYTAFSAWDHPSLGEDKVMSTML